MAGVALASGDVDHAERILDEATSVLRRPAPGSEAPLYIRAMLAVRRGDPSTGSPVFERVSSAAGSCTTSSRSCTRSRRWPPRRRRGRTMSWRREPSARVTPSPSRPAHRRSTNPSTTFENRLNGMCEPVSVRTAGRARLPRDARLHRFVAEGHRRARRFVRRALRTLQEYSSRLRD